MRSQLITGLTLLACGQMAWGDEQPKTPARTRPHAGTAAPADAPDAPRTVQTVARRPLGTAGNPAGRPVNPRLSPINRNRPAIPGSTVATNDRNRAARDPVSGERTNNRPSVTRPGQRPTNAGVNGAPARLPARTGNEITFAQARAQCTREHHNRDWWRHHHGVVCFYGGGFWFWNAGWWFPAWGYSPYYTNYVYDGPIYGVGQLSPGDVTAQVQEALAQQGYYYGAIDGVLGPETRDAILRFQADNGLATTAAIDEPTLDTLGLT